MLNIESWESMVGACICDKCNTSTNLPIQAHMNDGSNKYLCRQCLNQLVKESKRYTVIKMAVLPESFPCEVPDCRDMGRWKSTLEEGMTMIMCQKHATAGILA